MKRFSLFAVMFVVMVLFGGLLASGGLAGSGKRSAIVEFTRPVKLMDTFLSGRYLFVHDDDRMAQGEPCLYVYRQYPGRFDELVVSFHCRSVERTKADRVKVRVSTMNTPFGVPEVQEIQFAGETRAHQVP